MISQPAFETRVQYLGNDIEHNETVERNDGDRRGNSTKITHKILHRAGDIVAVFGKEAQERKGEAVQLVPWIAVLKEHVIETTTTYATKRTGNHIGKRRKPLIKFSNGNKHPVLYFERERVENLAEEELDEHGSYIYCRGDYQSYVGWNFISDIDVEYTVLDSEENIVGGTKRLAITETVFLELENDIAAGDSDIDDSDSDDTDTELYGSDSDDANLIDKQSASFTVLPKDRGGRGMSRSGREVRTNFQELAGQSQKKRKVNN
jgi:hypothetical protein